MNNVDYVVICANKGVNKCNLLVHPDPGLNLPVASLQPFTEKTQNRRRVIDTNCMLLYYYVCFHYLNHVVREGGSHSLFRDDTGFFGFWPFSGV